MCHVHLHSSLLEHSKTCSQFVVHCHKCEQPIRLSHRHPAGDTTKDKIGFREHFEHDCPAFELEELGLKNLKFDAWSAIKRARAIQQGENVAEASKLLKGLQGLLQNRMDKEWDEKEKSSSWSRSEVDEEEILSLDQSIFVRKTLELVTRSLTEQSVEFEYGGDEHVKPDPKLISQVQDVRVAVGMAKVTSDDSFVISRTFRKKQTAFQKAVEHVPPRARREW